MRINLCLLTMCLICLSWMTGSAQTLDARQIMDRTARAFQQAGGMQVTFTVQTNEQHSQGIIAVRGEKFVLESNGVKTWFDGKTQWSYVAANEEVNISEPTREELQSINPYAWLYLYRQGYQLSINTHQTRKNVYEVILTATQSKRDIQRMALLIDRKNFRPSQITVVPKSSKNVSVIQIKSYKIHQPYTDSYFVFDKRKYPRAEVIDLR